MATARSSGYRTRLTGLPGPHLPTSHAECTSPASFSRNAGCAAKGSEELGYAEDACAAVIEGLDAIGLDYFIHVPDSFGAPVIAHFEADPTVRSFPVAREEEGIGIASGLAMTGKKAVLFYQDTGLGNSIGALTTYAMAYHSPMLLLAIRRGGFGEFNAANFNFSESAIEMVEAMRLKAFVLDYRVPLDSWPVAISQAYSYALMTNRPIVMFLNLKE